MATTAPKVLGYLPNDTPPFGRLVLLALQHVLTMFPATVLCAMIMNFDVSTVLAVTGFGTIVALLGSKFAMGKYIPLYYGSSFSYLAAVGGVMAVVQPDLKGAFGQIAKPETIAVVTAGFLATGLINVIVGLIIRLTGGKETIDKILPPIITGSVACTIGIGLGASALNNAGGINLTSSAQAYCNNFACLTATGNNLFWFVAFVTLVATILFSVYLQGKGFIGMLPILLGGILGYIVASLFGLVDFANIFKTSVISMPIITFPNFASPYFITAVVGIGVMAIATIPESTAHLYQISLYIDHLAEEQGREKYNLSRYIGLNLMLDGLDDIINGLFGSTAGTNYGENNSLMVITRNYSGPVLIGAGVIAIVLGFIGPLKDIIYSIPVPVTGGLSIYLFGVIGMQGIALMMAEKVNLYDPRQLAIGAVILIVGIAGNIGYPNGFLPIPLLQGVFPNGWPAIATGAVLGILLNLIFFWFKPSIERASVNK
jgi:uracil permease